MSERAGPLLLGLCWLLALYACEPEPPNEPRHVAPPPALTRVQLGEAFDLGEARRCIVEEARPYLAERKVPAQKERVVADVLVLRVTAHCESGQSSLERARWTWLSPQRRAVRESTTTTTPPAPSAKLQRVFEAKAGAQVPPTRWRFSAAGDSPVEGAGELRIRSGHGDVDVVLREAPRDVTLHAALSQVLKRLRSGELPASCGSDGCVERAREAHAAGLFEEPLELSRSERDGKSAMRVWLASPSQPDVAQLTLRFTLSGTRWRLEDLRAPPQQPASAARCEALRRAHQRRLREAFAAASASSDECNMLGWLVPQRCAEVAEDPGWQARGLRTLRACGDAAVQSLLRHDPARIPEDFQVTLRRDRCRGSLDRCPRYTLAVYGNGVTVFHGKHWVSHVGRSDGRTHPRLLAGLWQSLRAMAFLTRKAGGFSRDPRCSARGSDHGNLLRVQAAGQSRMVVDREGCRGNFTEAELDRLAELVDAVAQVQLWTGARPRYADRHAQVWTLSGD